MTLTEALEDMLDRLCRGQAVLRSGGKGSITAIPTIHRIGNAETDTLRSTTEVRHCGFGLFVGNTASGRFSFDGGSAMRHARDEEGTSVFGWTPLSASPEVLYELGYNFEAALSAVNAALGQE